MNVLGPLTFGAAGCGPVWQRFPAWTYDLTKQHRTRILTTNNTVPIGWEYTRLYNIINAPILKSKRAEKLSYKNRRSRVRSGPAPVAEASHHGAPLRPRARSTSSLHWSIEDTKSRDERGRRGESLATFVKPPSFVVLEEYWLPTDIT